MGTPAAPRTCSEGELEAHQGINGDAWKAREGVWGKVRDTGGSKVMIQTCNTEGPALQKDLFPFWPPPPNTPQDTPAPTSFQHGLTWFLGSFPMCFLTISVALSNSLFLMQTITACRGKQGQFEAGHREQLSANFHTDQLPHHCRHEFADNKGMPHMRQLPPSSTQDLSKAKTAQCIY